MTVKILSCTKLLQMSKKFLEGILLGGGGGYFIGYVMEVPGARSVGWGLSVNGY